MLGTFKEYCSRLRVCTLSIDAHPYEFFWLECEGYEADCLPDIVHRPLLGTFFLINSSWGSILGGLVALMLKLLSTVKSG